MRTVDQSLPTLFDVVGVSGRTDVLLAPHLALGVGGPARFVATPESIDATARLWSVLHERDIPVLVLGAGTRTLVSDYGFEGVVVDLSLTFSSIEYSILNRWQVGAACPVRKLLRRAVARRADVGVLAQARGSVGGALCADVRTPLVLRALVVDGARARWLPGEEAWDVVARGGWLLTVEFEPMAADAAVHAAQAELLARDVRPATGPVFKDAAGVSAASLLAKAGLLGKGVGGVVLSAAQPNFLVNEGRGTAIDAHALVEWARGEVRSRCGSELRLALSLRGTFVREGEE